MNSFVSFFNYLIHSLLVFTVIYHSTHTLILSIFYPRQKLEEVHPQKEKNLGAAMVGCSPKDTDECFHQLMSELKIEDTVSYMNFLRVETRMFDELVQQFSNQNHPIKLL